MSLCAVTLNAAFPIKDQHDQQMQASCRNNEGNFTWNANKSGIQDLYRLFQVLKWPR